MARLSADLVLSLRDKVSGPARGVGQSIDRLNAKTKRGAVMAQRNTRLTAASAAGMGKAQTMALAGISRVVAPLATGYAVKQVVTAAADFESSLTGIQKKAGISGEATAKLGNEIKDLATSGDLAVPIEELLAAYERGAAAGLPTEELEEFASLSAKAADAFEMSAEDVGNAAAGFGTSLNLPIGEMERYFDLINGLADSGISDESDIVKFVDRAGAQLKMMGLTNEQIAAYGSTMLNLKMPAEVAARAMNTLSTKLLTPQSTKKSKKAFEQLYGSADEFTEMMKDDANGAVEDFLKRLEGLDKFERTEILTDILGQGFADEINRVVAALPELRRNLDYAAGSEWFGSLSDSYQLKLDDFWSQWQIMKNKVETLAIDLGGAGMPILKNALTGARELVDDIQDGMAAFEANVDFAELDKVKTSVSELAAQIGEMMGMGGDGSPIQSFFEKLAGTVNAVSNGVNIVQDVAQSLGLAAPDDDTPETRQGRVQKLVDGYAEFNPRLGKPIKGIYDTYTRTPEEQEAAIADREAYWSRQGEAWEAANAPGGPPQRKGLPARPPPAKAILPALDYPTSAPSGAVRTIPIPTPAPRGEHQAAAPAGMSISESQLAEIDQQLGALLDKKNQLEDVFRIAPDPVGIETMRAIGDEMQRLMEKRDAVMNSAPSAAPPPAVALPPDPDFIGPVQREGERASLAAEQFGRRIASAISVTATPTVNTGSIEAARQKVAALANELARIPGLARDASVAAQSARVDYSGLHADLSRAG